MQAWKLAPALATGNVVVMKPAEQTPLTALYVASLVAEFSYLDSKSKTFALQLVVSVLQLACYKWARFVAPGQRCFVEEPIYDEFVKRSVERAKNRVVGNPFDLKTEQGPQVDGTQFGRIMAMIDSGNKEGAKLECGGAQHGDKGFFIQPTVFSDVQDDMRIAKERLVVTSVSGATAIQPKLQNPEY
ncbi:Aldehyde dehydrogenase, mitochondrial [Desmophyllum pertusum]|uniref:Aldehyde dehydrogenase, mitochondrial n=1 Tax=Desmophyllum pertusum TaxID=174260 RepID=A0A9W9ZKH8_9CNID|nr:Aldehyde dehydrogenase, mitochondrial [Desmophyllum pertusum]